MKDNILLEISDALKTLSRNFLLLQDNPKTRKAAEKASEVIIRLNAEQIQQIRDVVDEEKLKASIYAATKTH